MEKVAAPTIDKIRYFNRDAVIVDDKTTRVLDEIFDYLKDNIKYDEKDGEEDYYFEFYYQARRGEIEDFESFEDCVECYEISTFEEYQNIWKREYPKENYWYHFELRKVIYENKKYYLIAINNNLILNVDPLNARGWEENRTNLVNIVYDVVKDFIEFAKNTDYNDYVNDNLDYELREGILLLKDYWEIEPDEKKKYFDKLANIDICDFIEKVNNQNVDNLVLIEDMTANKYYEICKIAYNAIGKDDKTFSSKELFYKNADGRDQGLSEINGNSIEEFNTWYRENEHHFDHTFEILPGRSFYRANLWIVKKDNGYYLKLSGKNFWTSLDVIKIYVELIKNNIPVILCDAELITKRLLGESNLAIISTGKTAYGYHKVFEQYFLDGMHLPEENRELFIGKIKWEDIPKLEIKNNL